MFIVRFLQIGPLQAAFFVHYLQKNAQHLDTPTRYAFVDYPWNYRGKFVGDHGIYGTFMEDEYPHMHAYARYCTVSITAVQVVIA